MCHFWSQNGPFASPPKKILIGKLLKSFSSTYYSLSLCKIFKKFFHRIQSYEDVQFLGPKWPISPNENFFRKPVNKPCFFHSCLSTCQKSKWDINLLVKYWRLKNTEVQKPCFWAIFDHFWSFLHDEALSHITRYGPLIPC